MLQSNDVFFLLKHYKALIFIFFLFWVSFANDSSAANIKRVLSDTVLSDGVRYRYLEIGNRSRRHRVHVIEADLNNPSCSIALIPGGERAGGLDKIHELAARYDSLRMWEVAAAVNGSFWRAYDNFPIGPTFIDGEALEIYTYKNWSSVFFDEDNRIYIDTFRINATLKNRKGGMLKIDRVNRRRDSSRNVIYNRFAGDTIPCVMTEKIEQALDEAQMEAMQDTLFSDETEEMFNLEKLKAKLLENERMSSIEYGLTKAIVEYVDEPAVNLPVRCVVREFVQGIAPVPGEGFVLSFGSPGPTPQWLLQPGDTLILKYETNVRRSTVFRNSVSATPRLIRNGFARHEAEAEGSRSRRFIRSRLPRTALGTDRSGMKLVLATVEKGSRRNGNKGASLADLSAIMKTLGCYNAMNLDGGGSSVMLIDGKNVTRPERPEISRKIAIGIAVIRPKSGLLEELFFGE